MCLTEIKKKKKIKKLKAFLCMAPSFLQEQIVSH